MSENWEATILAKLRRFEECAANGDEADIGSDWFVALTTLGLLHRVAPNEWIVSPAGLTELWRG